MLHGLPWLEQPVTVVDDGDACLAVTLEPGSRFTFFAHPFGAHPWAAYEVWSGSTVLQLQREGDAYGVWKFFDLEQQFTHWYINFQAPLVRRVDTVGGGAFETADLGLDIVIPADALSWEWKDVDDPDAMVANGRITAAERAGIAEEADRVTALLNGDDRWWSCWDEWCPQKAAEL
jgi:hypothetical protein